MRIAKSRLLTLLAAVFAVSLVAAGGSLALGSSGSAEGGGARSAGLAACTQEALQQHPGAALLEAEAGDDGSAYEVELRLEGGQVVEVQMDGDCRVLGQDAEDGQDRDGASDPAER